jgi:hypothetical protein
MLERFHLQVEVQNPLNTPLRLTDITLQTESSELQEAQTASTEVDVQIQPVPDQLVPAKATRLMTVAITANSRGLLRFTGVRYRFHGLMWQYDRLSSKGKRLSSEKKHRLEKHYDEDRHLSVPIAISAPRMKAFFVDRPTEVYQGVHGHVVVRIRNTGTIPFKRVCIATDHPQLFISTQEIQTQVGKTGVDAPYESIGNFDFPAGSLVPGAEYDVTLRNCYLQSGDYQVRLMFICDEIVRMSNVSFADQIDTNSYRCPSYQSDDSSPVISMSTRVKPSIGVSAMIDRPTDHPNQAAIAMTASSLLLASMSHTKLTLTIRTRLSITPLQPLY